MLAHVLIADDHAMVRAGLRQFLESEEGIGDVGEAASGRQTLDLLRAKSWQLLLLDIEMPDRSGLDILRHIQSSFPDVRVLVVSGYPERQYATNVLKAGAMGYVSKVGEPDELIKAIRTVLAGHRYVSSSLAEMLVTQLRPEIVKPPHSCLSEREFQIFWK